MRNPVSLFRLRKGFIIIIITLAVFLNQQVMAQPRIIEFSDYSWLVKTSNRKQAPGPNMFSNDEELVWVDSNGDLHLAIKQLRNKQWVCSEIISRQRFGYGTFVIEIQSDLAVLDPNVVLGLFTYDPSDFEQYYSELDIEFSRWGDPEKPLGNFTVQPYTEPANSRRFNIGKNIIQTTHVITWAPGVVRFKQYVMVMFMYT